MTAARNILITSILLLSLSCSENQGTVALQGSQNPAGPQISDQSDNLTIGPVNARARTVITLRTNNHAVNSSAIHWYINGREESMSRGFRLKSVQLKKGDSVQAVITDGDREYKSNEIIIKNTPPLIQKAGLAPSMPVVSSMIETEVTAYDADGDNISFQYHWTLNGRFAGEEGYIKTALKRGDVIMVEITPFDGEEHGQSVKLKGSVFNSLPTVSEGAPVLNGNVYTYQIRASDPDNDILTYTLEQGPEGLKVSPSGLITWKVNREDSGTHEIKVLISDNNGGKIILPLTTRIDFQNSGKQS